MQADYLLQSIKATLLKVKAEKLAAIAASGNFSMRELIDITFHPDEQIGFRAAWILENVCALYPERFATGLHYFLEKFSGQTNPSARRHFAKIASLITGKRTLPEIKKTVELTDPDRLIETLFSWLIDEKTLVAVKVHCMQALANLSGKNDWVKDELLQTIDYLSGIQSVAFFTRAKAVKKQMV